MRSVAKVPRWGARCPSASGPLRGFREHRTDRDVRRRAARGVRVRRANSFVDADIEETSRDRGARVSAARFLGRSTHPSIRGPEKLHFTKAAARSFEILYTDLERSDLCTSCPELAVPMFIALGRYDRMAPTEIAERYFNGLTSPHKESVWFEQSAHFPQMGATRQVPATSHPNRAPSNQSNG